MKNVDFDLCKAGFCTHPEIVTLQSGSFRSCEFPSLFGLIVHPQEGLILFDTGYHPDYNLKSKWPESIYPFVIPARIDQSQTAAQHVIRKGFLPEDVKWIVISHFHGDHIAGLRDFQNAKFLCRKFAFDSILNKSSLRNLLNGFLPHLLPKDFSSRVEWIEDRKTWSQDFAFGAVDLFGDDSLIAVDLPGHKAGQVGLVFQSHKIGKCFLVADAAWSLKAIIEMRPPSRLANLIIDSSSKYLNTLGTLQKINKEQPEMTMIPSHCRETFQKISGRL